jgi:hypothetical protein
MHGANFFYPQTAVFLGSETPRPCVPWPKPGHTRGAKGSPDGLRRAAFIDRMGQAHVESGSTFGVLTQ